RKTGSGPFATLRSGAHPDKVRLVVDAAPSLDARVTFSSHGLRWTVSPAAPAAVAAAPAPQAAPGKKSELKDGEVEIDGHVVTVATAAAAPTGGPQAEMLDLGFVESARGGRIHIKLSRGAQFEVDRPDDRGASSP